MSTQPTALWRNRDFMLLQAGQLLSTFGSNISGIAYPLLALAVTHSAQEAGYVGAVVFVPMLLFNFPAGVAADRYDRRTLMIVSDALGATSVGTLAAAVILDQASLWLILVVAFVDSTAGVFFRAGNSGAFRAVVPQSQLADAASLSQARAATVRLAAPPAGGALFGIARSLPFVADAVSYTFSTLSLLLMRTRFQEQREPTARTDLREGLTFFWRMPFLRTTVGMIAASNFAAAGVPLAVIVLARDHGISSAGIGAFVVWPNVYVLAGAFAVQAFTFVNTDSAVAGYSYALIPDRLLGRAMSASNTLRVAVTPLGPLVAGILLSHTSPRITIIVLAVPVLAAALAGTLSPSMRRLPSLEASPATSG